MSLLKEANAERLVAVAQQSANSGTIAKLEQEIDSLKELLQRSEQRAAAAEEVSTFLGCRNPGMLDYL